MLQINSMTSFWRLLDPHSCRAPVMFTLSTWKVGELEEKSHSHYLATYNRKYVYEICCLKRLFVFEGTSQCCSPFTTLLTQVSCVRARIGHGANDGLVWAFIKFMRKTVENLNQLGQSLLVFCVLVCVLIFGCELLLCVASIIMRDWNLCVLISILYLKELDVCICALVWPEVPYFCVFFRTSKYRYAVSVLCNHSAFCIAL